MDLTGLTPPQLLVLHSELADELRARGITRSSNNPTGDLAEYLFCRAFIWEQADNSERNVDAVGPDGTRYQIKGRRIKRFKKSRQLSAIRDMAGSHFDFIAGVLFNRTRSSPQTRAVNETDFGAEKLASDPALCSIVFIVFPSASR